MDTHVKVSFMENIASQSKLIRLKWPERSDGQKVLIGDLYTVPNPHKWTKTARNYTMPAGWSFPST